VWKKNHKKENRYGLRRTSWKINLLSDPHPWKAGFEMVRMVARFSITHTNGETDIKGEVSYQAALHGILAKISDLGSIINLVEKNTPCKKEE
jgi:hypothetical protein